jgi:hypothetical protein
MQNSPVSQCWFEAQVLRPWGSSPGGGGLQAASSRSGSKHSPVAVQHASGASQGWPLQYTGPGGGIGVAAPLPPFGFEFPPNDAPLEPAEVPALPLDPESPPSSSPEPRDLDEPPQPTNAAATSATDAERRTPRAPEPCIARF